jgi:hypothetical protein
MEGGCACGAVRYRLKSAPMFVHCCHCHDCQRQTGSAFVLNALIEADRVEVLSGETVPVSMPTDSGKPHLIYRCPKCQTAMWSEYGGRAPRIAFCPRRHARRSCAAAAGRAHLHALETALGRASRGRAGIRNLLRDAKKLWPAEASSAAARFTDDGPTRFGARISCESLLGALDVGERHRGLLACRAAHRA